MSNPYLAVLVTRRRSYFGSDGAAYTVMELVADPRVQSPRLYTALAKGGGVIKDQAVASTLAQTGFTVTTFSPTEAERAYLNSVNPSFLDAPQLWLVTCDAGVAYKRDGVVRCGLPWVQEVPLADAQAAGAVSAGDFGPAEQWVSRNSIAGWKVYTTSEKETPELVRAALKTLALWDGIATRVQQLESAYNIAGRPMSPTVAAVFVRASAFLAETAQPAAMVRKVYGTPAPSRFGVAQVPAGVIVVGVIVLVVVAGLAYLASKQVEAAAISAEIQKIDLEARKPFVDCIVDKTISREERAMCAQSLKELPGPPAPQKGPWDYALELAPYVTGVVALGLGAFYVGPVVRELSETGAAGLERLRERHLTTT